MARVFNAFTLQLLSEIAKKPEISPSELWQNHKKICTYKELYNTVFRLSDLDLITKEKLSGSLALSLTEEGKKVLYNSSPERDGIWKLVIFDIPEKHKYVRTVLRAKLKALHFKKWQNSIWVSPYQIHPEIEAELLTLGKKFFIRLIKSQDINITEDLEKLFN